MKFKKEIKIGIVVTVVIFLFLWGYNFLKGRNLFSSYNYYYAVFPDVSGLQKSSPVIVNGYVVGLVKNIKFTSDDLSKLYVEIGVKKDFKIPDNSTILITSEFLGAKSISLLIGDSKQMAAKGDTLSGSIGQDLIGDISGKLIPVAENAVKLIVSVDSVLHIIQNIFDAGTQGRIQKMVAELESMIIDERKKISHILSDFESVSGNLKDNNEAISKVITNLGSFSDSLSGSEFKSAINHANLSMKHLHSILADIDDGKGTIGNLTHNDSAYIYLKQSLNDLDKLLIDLKKNPKRYVHFSVFGKKNK